MLKPFAMVGVRKIASNTLLEIITHLNMAREGSEWTIVLRMGSFTSAARVLHEDCQDDDFKLPEPLSRAELLAFCSAHLSPPTPIIRRTFLLGGEGSSRRSPRPEVHSIRVLQWNLLSQCLGVNHDQFACCPPGALDWHRRKLLIVQEIISYFPDLICLQEVDHFKFLRKVLGSQGYSGIFFPKPDSPCAYIEGNNGPDGCAIFYQSTRFTLVAHYTRVLEVWNVQSNQVVIVAVLRNIESGEELAIASTHLKARSGALLAALRDQQGKDLIQFLSESAEGRPVILCGDFNATPSEAVYSRLTSNDELALDSAYARFGGAEPPYTTWKIRSDGEHCQTIDYVFVSRGRLAVEDVLAIPGEDSLGAGRLPSWTYPSDHLAIACDLTLLPYSKH